MKKQYTSMEKAQSNALENNIGGFSDPELWEAIKTLYGGITKENHWTVWRDYWKAMGEKGTGTWLSGHFETDYEYSNDKVRGLVILRCKDIV